jgi:hypothetical protein
VLSIAILSRQSRENSCVSKERLLLNTAESKRICEWAVYDPYADMRLIYVIGQLPLPSGNRSFRFGGYNDARAILL